MFAYKNLLLSLSSDSKDLLHWEAWSCVGTAYCADLDLGTNAVSVFLRRKKWNLFLIFFKALQNMKIILLQHSWDMA
jgi:hypothetical protein